MAIKLRKPIKITPIDVVEKTAVGIRLPFNKKKVFTLDYTTRDHAKSKLTNVLFEENAWGVNCSLSFCLNSSGAGSFFVSVIT